MTVTGKWFRRHQLIGFQTRLSWRSCIHAVHRGIYTHRKCFWHFRWSPGHMTLHILCHTQLIPWIDILSAEEVILHEFRSNIIVKNKFLFVQNEKKICNSITTEELLHLKLTHWTYLDCIVSLTQFVTLETQESPPTWPQEATAA